MLLVCPCVLRRYHWGKISAARAAEAAKNAADNDEEKSLLQSDTLKMKLSTQTPEGHRRHGSSSGNSK
jgi:hypothetical protein